MAEVKKEEGKNAPSKQVIVKSEKIVGSLYAQIVGVVVTDWDVTLEFVYVNPRPGTEEAQVISRITLPREAGEGLAKSIAEVIAEHDKKKGMKK